jgi:tripartite-type tricarboxylate transporter receptor subunit TctC
MTIFRRALLAAPLAMPALAQSNAIRLVVGFPPGGSTDLVARLMQPHLASILGVPVVVENRPGASGALGAQQVARAAGDGTTWAVVFDTHAVNPFLIPNMGFDGKRDLAPVMLIGTAPNLVLKHRSRPWTDFAAMLAAARARPDTLTYGTIGNGSLAHLTMSLAQVNGNFKVVHVPYRGGGPLVTAAAAAECDLYVATLTIFAAMLREGIVQALAVTSAERFSGLPQVPTMVELGVPGINAQAFWGVLGPATTPAPIRARMEAAVREVLNLPEVRTRLTDQLGVDVVAGDGAAFGAFLDGQMEIWGRVVRENNIRPD